MNSIEVKLKARWVVCVLGFCFLGSFARSLECTDVMESLAKNKYNFKAWRDYRAELLKSSQSEDVEYAKLIEQTQVLATIDAEDPRRYSALGEEKALMESIGKHLASKYHFKNAQFFGGEISGTLSGKDLMSSGALLAESKYLVLNLKLVDITEGQLRQALANPKIQPLLSRIQSLDLVDTELGNTAAEALARTGVVKNLRHVSFKVGALSGSAKLELDDATSSRRQTAKDFIKAQ